MTQQTQVGRVVAAYERFLERFPTVEALAAADVDDVLRAFSGLGYYRRARSLHQAARAIAARGGWPSSVAELSALPGFGPYTAAAVAAFAFGGDTPPVDGNVARVTARVRGLPLAMGCAPLLKEGGRLAREVYADVGTQEIWEALMELGATVCTPARPRCDACPLAGGCVARGRGTPTAFPLPRARRERERHLWVAVWLERPDGRVLLREVAKGGLLEGLWLPPISDSTGAVEPEDIARSLASEAGFEQRLERARAVRHTITHRDIRILPFVGSVRSWRLGEPRAGWSWQDPRHLTVPAPSLVAKLADACAGRTAPLPFRAENGG
jgi:A/G-specific adenine glycosylase